jgi:hypothetical protein
VGLGGVEPPTSSLSGIEGSALCGPPFSQVAGDRKGRRDAFLVDSFPTVQASQAGPHAHRGSSISLRPLWRPGLLMLGTSTTGRSGPGPRVAPTPVSTPRERGHGPTPTQTAAAGDPDPGRRGAGGQRPHGRAAAPCPAHRRAARPPPTRTSRLTKADAAGVVSGLPGRTLSGQSWWQVAQPRASSPAAPNPAPGLTSPSHHLTTPRAGVRPQTRRFVHVAAGLVPGAADTP